ncbi:hypothetical protein MRS44_016271 [Fusarium solani]|jgi:hypothetical protein|uniref:BZIP domain-containing protein n=1 Tax=Fusarium solani TaxID=169388 RepID=A0A9P9JRL4_FUSSL|nr:uncharacterized protein B0J15DRAFT_570735 [Fusarium solani]KAH7234403.1 hypothetical protein B0J15DRAFT_570735 [Fusarium solani]KAJ3456248.1 hypothetical protein MRS44_016271 [Fusarium solani]KAJ4214310.1 hypothetical protein NW759_010327 [Fusarium solani]
MVDTEAILDTGFFELDQPPSQHELISDGQIFDPDSFSLDFQDLAAFCTPDSRMLSSAPSFTTSSPAASNLQRSSGQRSEIYVDDTAIDRFSYNMALEHLVPSPADFQQAIEITELAPSASSPKYEEPGHAPSAGSKKQQRDPASGLDRELPRRMSHSRNSKEVPRKGRRGASKRGRRGSATSDEEFYRKRLEGNRLAAERSRQRRRSEAQALVAQGDALQSHNQYLSSYYSFLKEEVLRTRMELLQHAGCDCLLIREYIEKEARRTVDSLSPRVSTSTG